MIETLDILEAHVKKEADLQHKIKLGAFWTILSWIGNFCLVWVV